jgi:hypothetical protein
MKLRVCPALQFFQLVKLGAVVPERSILTRICRPPDTQGAELSRATSGLVRGVIAVLPPTTRVVNLKFSSGDVPVFRVLLFLAVTTILYDVSCSVGVYTKLGSTLKSLTMLIVELLVAPI